MDAFRHATSFRRGGAFENVIGTSGGLRAQIRLFVILGAYMSRTKISVIIPAFNMEAHIERCLQSLVDQNTRDMEVLVYDDSSTDDTASIVKRWEEEHGFIHLTSLGKNIGQGGVRNLGLDSAKGKYVCFLDHDDWLERDALGFLYETAEETRSDVVVLNHQKAWAGGRKKINNRTDLFDVPDKSQMFGREKWKFVYDILAPWNKFYRLDFVKEHGIRFQESRLYEDIGWSVQAIYFSNKLTITNRVLYNYFVSPASTFRSASSDHSRIFAMYDRLLNELTEKGAEREFIELIHGRMIEQYIGYMAKYRNKMTKSGYRDYFLKAGEYMGEYMNPRVEKTILEMLPKRRGKATVRQIRIVRRNSPLIFHTYTGLRNAFRRVGKLWRDPRRGSSR
jgi:glycosyltransferase involved in cell wall biosynthesis